MNRQKEQLNKIGNPGSCGHLIYDKSDVSNHWGKDGLFNKSC